MDESGTGAAAVWNFDERRRTLRKKRKELKLSQASLAELAGVDVGTVSQFETGARDLKDSTLARVEEALTDAMAAARMLGQLRGQRVQKQIAPLSEMAPPRPGTEAYWQQREKFVEHGSRRMTELEAQNVELLEANALLRDMVSKLEEQARNWQEAYTLQSEVIRLFEAEEVQRPKEADALLQRAAAVAKK